MQLDYVVKEFVRHSFEAMMEISEVIYKKIISNNDPNYDPIYDMHFRNAKKIIKKIAKRQ